MPLHTATKAWRCQGIVCYTTSVSDWILASVFLLAAALLYGLWSALDKRRETHHKKLLDETQELGEDAVPGSLHPEIDPYKCIGSGSCIAACPEKNVLGIVAGKATLVGPLACIGHGACAASCPVGAIRLVFGTETRGLELPYVDPNFQTRMPGLYIVGELGGMGLIRNAVSQGAQAASHVAANGRRGEGKIWDAVVVGAGPAGISATLRLMQSKYNVLLLESESFGGTITHYPRAKIAMTGTLDIPLVGRIRKRTMTKEELLALWNGIREKTGLNVMTGQRVEALSSSPDGTHFVVQSSEHTFRAANVLLALGRRGTPNRLGVPGEELPKVAYRLLEPREFAGQHVLVVGGGNSAVENALSLADSGVCKSVTISYRRGAFARCRSENKARIDAAIRAGAIRSLLPSEVKSIAPHAVHLHVDGVAREIANDAVIVQIGGTAPSQLLKSFGIELVTKYGEA
jgi:thioredoxin reductase (NADPH)